MPKSGSEYAQILALARSGATLRAWDLFAASDLSRAEDDSSALTLKGRLLKDRARRAGEAERAALFAQAGAAYQRAAKLSHDSYPLVNAAAMALFAGDRIRAELCATEALYLIESGQDKGETPYWGEATRAEAYLLLNRTIDAQASLAKAIQLAPEAWEDHAATLRQFGLILSETGRAAEWLDPLRPPPVIHFNGILGIDHRDAGAREAIGAAIGQIRPGFAFGALAAGADIIAAQALLAANAELHLVLPSDPSDFCQSSVAPFGADWVADFDTIMASAHSVTICGDSSGTSGAGVALAEYHAMGLAVEKAGQLQTQAIALRIEPAGRPTLGDPWRSSGRPYRHVALSAKHDQISAPLPEGRLQFDVAVEGSGTSSYPTLNEAQLAVRGSISARVAIDCHTGNGNRVVAFLGRGEPGMLVASRDAALALLASGMTERIETLGEMATTGGALEICLVTLPPMQD